MCLKTRRVTKRDALVLATLRYMYYHIWCLSSPVVCKNPISKHSFIPTVSESNFPFQFIVYDCLKSTWQLCDNSMPAIPSTALCFLYITYVMAEASAGLFNFNEGLVLLKLAGTVLILINTGPSNVNTHYTAGTFITIKTWLLAVMAKRRRTWVTC